METNRREFLKKIIMAGGVLALKSDAFGSSAPTRKKVDEIRSTVHRAVNGPPDANLQKVIELMGGIESIVGADDVIVIKPNVQWWNQGAPNLSALSAFVEMVMNRVGGFKGEVVIAENSHRGASPWTSLSSGWAQSFNLNSDSPGLTNFNDLSKALKRRYGKRFTTSHWINVAVGNKRVNGPADGSGYVYCDGTGGVPLLTFDNGANGDSYRAVVMTYPVFQTEKGTMVDFKNGVWKKGAYTGRALKFINFAALNHHSTYCGSTSAIKNYLGISDLSGGPDPHNGGRLTEEYFNFHSFPFDKWAPGPKPGMIGAVIGVFMNTVRKADLNITTAEWVGLASRTEPPMAHTRTVLACTDPVALDYHATKYILYPNSRLNIHNPDDKESPTHQYLVKCAEHGGGIFDERYVEIKSYDLKKGSFQNDSDLVVKGEKKWGTNAKSIMKYLYLRALSV